MKLIILFTLGCLMMQNVQADEPSEIVLWPQGAPGALGKDAKDIPTLTPFLPPAGSANGAAIVVFPGGGYSHLAPHEGQDYALFLSQRGFTCFVLKYRLGINGYHHPAMLNDASRAVRYIRANADQWKIDTKRVGVMGSSAGGHVASTLMTHFDAGDAKAADVIEQQSSRPDFAVLCYPVIDMADEKIRHKSSHDLLLGENPSADVEKELSGELQVTPQTPPCFIWAGADDKTVPVANSLRFAEACAQNHVSAELHVYEHARHGLGLGDKPPFAHPLPWTVDLLRWLETWTKPAG